MEMIESRIKSSHIYDEENAIEISKLIYKDYINLFNGLKEILNKQL
jgi:hypothetical protein